MYIYNDGGKHPLGSKKIRQTPHNRGHRDKQNKDTARAITVTVSSYVLQPSCLLVVRLLAFVLLVKFTQQKQHIRTHPHIIS